ncbi:MAG: hypothetical protein M5U34_44355 [Chloroflexi bacterium]|nr:hypothetical protein [Chloroflexota bacterium]
MSTISKSLSHDGSGEGAGWAVLKTVFSYGMLFLLALMFIYPFLLAIATSFKSLPEINQYPVSLIPKEISLEGYRRLLTFNVPLWTYNSAVVAVLITGGNLLFASLGGYALARIRFPGSKFVFLGILGTMMIPGIVC